MKTFKNRKAAGVALAQFLAQKTWDRKPLVLALPRGGVPVAAPIAQALQVPLDVLVVRKLGVPGWEELAAGAIGPGGVEVLNREVMLQAHLNSADLDPVRERELQELTRREHTYRGNRSPLNLEGHTVLLVDDGIATGATMQAAIQVARKLGAVRVLVTVPHGPPETVAVLEQQADEVVCLLVPDPYIAVGRWYNDFGEVTDREVQDLLAANL